MPISHQFVSAVADGTTLTEVRSTHWNAEHWSTITNSTAAFPEIVQRSTQLAAITNSSAQNVLTSFVVPARLLGTNRILHTVDWGYVVFGSTLTAGVRFELRYGTSRWADISINPSAAALTTNLWMAETWIYHPTGTSGRLELRGRIDISSVATPVMGLGDISVAGAAGSRLAAGLIGSSGSSGFTVTTGAVSTFALSMNWQVANTSLFFRKSGGYIELL